MENPENCPVRQVLATVTGKWQILILGTLAGGPARFGALKREIGGISQRVLTEKLRALERDGYLTRTVDAGPPIAVTYALTARGQSFHRVLKELINWAGDNLPDIEKSRLSFDGQ